MRALPRLISILALLVCTATLFAQDQYRNHMLVRVMPDSPAHLKALYRYSQLDLVPGETPDQPYLLAYPEDLEFLQKTGYRYEIIHQNEEQFYADRLHGAAELMGGYRTYAEIVTKLDSIHTAYPTLTTAKFSIGQTLQGRDMWVIKISDNPEVDENEPEVFFNSLIHAREPAAMEGLIYFMDYLLSHYGSDPSITDLVDNREVFVLPCVNPDGYVYNQTTNPSGGGMWRKNRKNNGDGSYGIDLNRNFDLAWGIDDNGSSPNGFDETYRGTAPFSELETQHIRDFVNAHQFVTELDYHTYQNLVLYPWGTSYYQGNGITVDNGTFQMIADSMAYFIHSVNGVWYGTGTPWQTLYNTNGGSFDWEYQESADHAKIFAFTTEVGGASDGFWPAPNRILPLAQENLPSDLFLMRIAAVLAPRPYAVSYQSQCESELNGNDNGVIEPSEDISLTVSLKNYGTEILSNLQGQISTADPWATIDQGTSAWPVLNSNAIGANSTAFQISIAANCPTPHLVLLSLHMTDAAGLDTTLSIAATVANYTVVDNVEGGVGGWTTGGSNNQWHISTRRANSPTHSWFSGADAGNYADDMSAYLMSDTLILSSGAQLSYDQWYNLESGFDFGTVEINTGAGWTQLVAPVTGSSGGWVHVTQNLNLACLGTRLWIRFHMTSDQNTNSEGWYVDNISTGCPVPSDISISPTAVTGVAPLGGTDSETLQICNVGQCPMSWSVTFNQLTPLFTASSDPLATRVAAPVLPDLDPYISKDGFDPRSGRDQLDTQGGPDAFGYTWMDSAEPDGPVYNWVELSGIGTALNFTSDDQSLSVTLPWTFSFYGTNYTTMSVSSNGNAHFSADTVDYGNRGIPNGRLPNAMMAVFWDDLSPQRAGSHVWTYNDVANARFVIQYDSVQRFSGGGLYTFELIMYQNGRIVYQYQSMVAPLDQATVGIENANGTDGLQVVNNAAYITNNLAIEFVHVVPWLTFGGPTSGTVDPSQCTNVVLNFAAGDLTTGTYNGEVVIQSNDPDENPLTVPITFLVGQLITPENLTIYYFNETDQLSFRWPSTGAPHYKLYSSTSSDGPFETLEATTSSPNVMIPAPANLRLFYVVVSSD
jgi:hypothetical protein